jgi:hypothetical protein
MNRTLIGLLVTVLSEGVTAAVKYLQSKAKAETPPNP